MKPKEESLTLAQPWKGDISVEAHAGSARLLQHGQGWEIFWSPNAVTPGSARNVLYMQA